MKFVRFGITGGIGSGKSFISRLLIMMDCSLYDSDSRAKLLMNNSSVIRSKLEHHFGKSVYLNSELNRVNLSSQVFGNPAKLKLLNSIVHPVVLEDMSSWFNSYQTGIQGVESALLFESKMDQYVDFIIGVVAPKSLRLRRAMSRDKASEEAIIARMNAQMSYNEMIKKCDFIIANDDKQALLPQLWELKEILEKKISK